MTWVSMDSDY